eukprot:COSAG06_NODE_1981_length_7924_cov_5.983642_3_plen_194_part_00
MPSHRSSPRVLALLALATWLGPLGAGAQQRARHPTGSKFSVGPMQVEVLHGPETCRVQAGFGDSVVVDYVGTFASSGREFDSSKKHKSGFSFSLGQGSVIRCWEEGLKGMCPGEKRQLHCPPEFAYGRMGSPPVIPPDTALNFEVELHRITPGPTWAEKMTTKLQKLIPLILIFIGCGWLFQKGVTTDRTKTA